VARGEFSNVKANPVEQVIPLEIPVKARYYKLSVLSILEGNRISIAEMGVLIGE
jgi:alpha-L-fucosidase